MHNGDRIGWNDEIQVLTQVLPDLTDILNHDQYQLDLDENMGVSNYYRKKPKNFKCYICKPNQ